MKKNSILLVFVLIVCTIWSTKLTAQEVKEEFKPSAKVWGFAFGDYYNKISSDADYDNSATKWGDGEFAKVGKTANGFTFRRVYLGTDFNIAKDFTAYFLLEGSDAATLPNGNRSVFLKQGYLQWKNIFPRHQLNIGLLPVPTWGNAEKVWNYRTVEKTITDFRKLGRATDLGVSLAGTFDADNNYGYTFAVGNGTGSVPEGNKYKTAYWNIYANFLNKKLLLELYGDYTSNKTGFYSTNIITSKFLIGYTAENFAVGFESILQTQENGKKDKSGVYADKKPFGMSLFGRVNLVKDKLAAFARYDNYSFDSDFKEGDNTPIQWNENFMVAGLDFMPNKNVHLMPNIWVNTYDDKSAAKSTRKADAVARLTFYFVFK